MYFVFVISMQCSADVEIKNRQILTSAFACTSNCIKVDFFYIFWLLNTRIKRLHCANIFVYVYRRRAISEVASHDIRGNSRVKSLENPRHESWVITRVFLTHGLLLSFNFWYQRLEIFFVKLTRSQLRISRSILLQFLRSLSLKE